MSNLAMTDTVVTMNTPLTIDPMAGILDRVHKHLKKVHKSVAIYYTADKTLVYICIDGATTVPVLFGEEGMMMHIYNGLVYVLVVEGGGLVIGYNLHDHEELVFAIAEHVTEQVGNSPIVQYIGE